MKSIVCVLLFLCLGVTWTGSIVFGQKTPVKYFGKEIGFEQIIKVEKRYIQFRDTIPNDTLYVCFKKEDFPCAYYRDVFLPVCLDGACYPASVRLYWTAGGGYLGYSLPGKGITGILTKNEHDAFKQQDYHDLDFFLADQHSVLKDYKLDELLNPEPENKEGKKNFEKKGIDAVSGATIAEAKSYSVPGAVYTTYTLWLTVHGPPADSVRKISQDFFSVPFVRTLIQADSHEDKRFALELIGRSSKEDFSTLVTELMDLMVGQDMDLREESTRILMHANLPDTLYHKILLQCFSKADHSSKTFLLDQFQDFPKLPGPVVDSLIISSLPTTAIVIQRILKMLQGRGQPGIATQLLMTGHLQNSNHMITEAIYRYLVSLRDLDPRVTQQILAYEIQRKSQ